MSFSRLIETLLLRDMLSYVVPGSLSLLVLAFSRLDAGYVIRGLKLANDLMGQTGAFIALTVISYVIGYVQSTVTFYVRDLILKRKVIPSLQPEILILLKATFGDSIDVSNTRQLVSLCLHYVECVSPEYYMEKIERRVSLRNFEIGLGSVMAICAVATAIYSHGIWKLIALVPLLGVVAFIRSSRNIDTSIDRLSFTLLQSVTASQKQSCSRE